MAEQEVQHVNPKPVANSIRGRIAQSVQLSLEIVPARNEERVEPVVLATISNEGEFNIRRITANLADAGYTLTAQKDGAPLQLSLAGIKRLAETADLSFRSTTLMKGAPHKVVIEVAKRYDISVPGRYVFNIKFGFRGLDGDVDIIFTRSATAAFEVPLTAGSENKGGS